MWMFYERTQENILDVFCPAMKEAWDYPSCKH